MKLILTQRIKGLGEKGQLVEVKDGYAKNLLLPKGLALLANDPTAGALIVSSEKTKKAQLAEQQKSQEEAEKIDGKEIIIKAKVGSKGQLFASIGEEQLRKNIEEQIGVSFIEKFEGLPIKKLGEQMVIAKFKQGKQSKITVKVVSDKM